MQISAGLQLIRWGNCLLAVASVLVGAYLTTGSVHGAALIVSCILVFFICAGGNVVNDLVDTQIDKVSHPARPLPSGKLSRQSAIRLAVALHIAAGGALLFAQWIIAVIGVGAMVLLFGYNLVFKRIPLVGNFVVALLGGLTFIVGGLAVGESSIRELPGSLIPAIFASLLHLIREIVKDVEDTAGDSNASITTLPLWLGTRAALGVVFGLYCLFVVVSLLPVVAAWYGVFYLLIVVVGIHIPIGALLTAALIRPADANISRAKEGLKLAMVVGVVALLLG